MQKENRKKENNILDFKSTIEAFIEEEKPEISQEEAIKSYKGDNNIRKKKGTSSEDSNNEAEDEEHLKRLKKELLESLERVNILAKKIFEEKGEKENFKNIKIQEDKINVKRREDIINEMREKVQNNQERSREK